MGRSVIRSAILQRAAQQRSELSPIGYRAFLFVALVGLLGAAATIFWLLVFGVNEERWKELAGA